MLVRCWWANDTWSGVTDNRILPDRINNDTADRQSSLARARDSRGVCPTVRASAPTQGALTGRQVVSKIVRSASRSGSLNQGSCDANFPGEKLVHRAGVGRLEQLRALILA